MKNATEFAIAMMSRHAAILSRPQVAQAESLMEDGEGWLAGYDMFQDGYEDDWLTERDVRDALELARRGMFSKFSAGVEKVATDRLRTLTADPAST